MKTEEMRKRKLQEGQELVLPSQFCTEVLNNIDILENRCFSSLQLLGLFASSKFYGNIEMCVCITVQEHFICLSEIWLYNYINCKYAVLLVLCICGIKISVYVQAFSVRL